MKFYSSDLHFGMDPKSKNLNRPYSTVAEMNEDIVEKINKTVTTSDELYLVGDISCYNFDPIRYLRRIKCKNKILLIGNHDARWLKNKEFKNCFKEIAWQKIVYDNDRKLLLTHCPQAEWDGYYKGILQFYGHVHKSLDGAGAYMSLLPNAFNVCCDKWEFIPRTAEEIINTSVCNEGNIKTLEELQSYFLKPLLLQEKGNTGFSVTKE